MNKKDVESLCERVRALGREGATTSIIGLEMGLSQAEIRSLREKYPAFDEAMTTSQQWALGWHERRLMENADNKAFSSQTATALLRAAFPDTYESATYKKDVAKTNTDASNIDYNAEVRELIRQLQEAGS